MENITELSGKELDFIIAVAQRAQENGQSVKIHQTAEGIKVKRGESMWTLPLGRKLA